MSRRAKFLAGLLLCGFGLLGALLLHGLRYPPLQMDPPPLPRTYRSEAFEASAEGAFLRSASTSEDLPRFRAFVPEPVLHFRAPDGGTVRFTIENLHPEARLDDAQARVERQGLLATVALELRAGEDREQRWRFPSREHYRFVAFGDAGGSTELSWCLSRARELKADFILHLGDIAYDDADFASAARQFAAAPVPIYAVPGNHDFHGGHRYRYRFFQEHFGPLNSFFRLAGTDFLGLDTAADLVPADRGQRGALLRRVQDWRARSDAAGRPRPLVVYTHRPLADPRVVSGSRAKPHALNRRAEADWLRARLLAMDAQVLLAGHIHHTFDFDDRGLRTIISGAGLGADGPDARILVGDFTPGSAPEFHWEALRMPDSSHDPAHSGVRD